MTELATSVASTQNNAPRTLKSTELTNVAGGDAVTSADVSGDGVIDLVVATRRSTQVYLGVPALK